MLPDGLEEALRRALDRLADLQSVLPTEASIGPGGVVGEAVDELAATLQDLQITHEELRVVAEELSAANELTQEHGSHYADLFEHAPAAYIVTDGYGVIREANAMARDLLVDRGRLIGRPLANLVTTEQRRSFRTEMNLARMFGDVRSWSQTLQPGSQAFTALLRVTPSPDESGTGMMLRWLVVPVDETAGISAPFAELEAMDPDSALRREAGLLQSFVDQAVVVAAGFDGVQAASIELEPVAGAMRIVASFPGDGSGCCQVKVPVLVEGGHSGTLMIAASGPKGAAQALAGALADMVGRYVEGVMRQSDLRAAGDHLRGALRSRIHIEQAKGRLAERLQLDAEDAFDRLRRFARERNEKLRDVAERVADGRLDVS